MQIRQSTTLQKHLHNGSREAQRAGLVTLMPDLALLAAIRDVRSHASKILKTLLSEWEVEQICLRLERDAARAACRALRADDSRQIVGGVIEGVERARVAMGGRQSNSGHLLLWAVGNRELLCSRVLGVYGVTAQGVGEELNRLPAHEGDEVEYESGVREESGDDGPVKSRQRRPRPKSLVEQHAANLTRAAREGAIDPVVGRSREIERLIQILGRRKKNNPVLIGEPGVGKTAIVEGLALRVVQPDAPASLRGKEIYSLDVASLIAGTKYRGEFEQRIKDLLKEISANRDIILFIDEIHTIVGAGSTQGSLDTANILKPALARGELQCVGATTLDEYRENIEADGALERRFQKIVVEPATGEQTLEILNNIRETYEAHHAVSYTPEALRACVELTGRYVADRHFPDKAIDAMDEAGSRASLSGVAEVDAAYVEAVITSMTGIPAERVSQNEKERLGAMGDHLNGRVIGQSAAVEKVVRSLRRSRAGLKDPDKPIGVFMFVGPTGVGKTYLAKELASWMFGRPDALVRVDMSEYSEKHNVSRMIGSPPGYVGYNEGGQLTEAVRRQPYSVVLFDEIEKAHPDVFNVMLQIFDDGQLTDGNGRKVDFRNTVIIMTSNVGSHTLAQKAPAVGYRTLSTTETAPANDAAHYRAALEGLFAPEFINRIDDVVVFDTLRPSDVGRIVDLELARLGERARGLGIEVQVTAAARRRLAEMGYEARYGVRALKRTILDAVEQPLANLLIADALGPGDALRIDVRKNNIKLSVKTPAAA